jgi:hypothetical protein
MPSGSQSSTADQGAQAATALSFDWQGPKSATNSAHVPSQLEVALDQVRDYKTMQAQRLSQHRGMMPSGSASSLISEATGPTSSLTYLSSSDRASHAAEQMVLLVRAAEQDTPYFATKQNAAGKESKGR